MNKKNQTALILLSGGLDSDAALQHAFLNNKAALTLTFDYGQKAAQREIAAAKALSEHFKVPHQTIKTADLFSNLPHPFFSDANLPEPNTEDLDNLEKGKISAKAVWVPNRNGILINIAAGVAESKNLNEVHVGFNAEEAATFPDNSQDFVQALNASLKFSTANGVRVVAPTVHQNKTEIVAELKDNGFPFELIWSCYRAEEKMCGKCESCKRLTRALAANGIDSNLS